jgi:hypothetical protein
MRSRLLLAVSLAVACGGDIGVKAPGLAKCDAELNEEESVVDGPFDQDGDGYYDASNEDCQEAWSEDELDCDDDDPDVAGPTDWFRDADDDGYGTEDDVVRGCTAEPGYVATSTDCDDSTAARHPAGDEICDGIDNDCDDIVDNDLVEWVYADADGDGYGDPETGEESCDPAADQVTNADDCDDTTGARAPDQDEICDGLDNDCDDIVDNDLIAWVYTDADGDGYGDPETAEESCDPGADQVTNDDDCDDTTASRSPDQEEICDGLDNDCDDAIDEDLSGLLYRDADSDGYGDPDDYIESCSEEAGYVDNPDDCNDDEAAAYPGGEEICDEIDNDCDGSVDEGAFDETDWYPDVDGDGWGDDAGKVVDCFNPGDYIVRGGDCDDDDASAGPDVAEVCEDDVDNDCDGLVDEGCGADRSGVYDLDDRIRYRCATGVVDISFDQVQVLDTDPSISFTSVASALPGTMTGTIASDDSFLASYVFAGTCTETYTISGSFTGDDAFSGTFSTSYVGGFFCYDCVGDTWSIAGTR